MWSVLKLQIRRMRLWPPALGRLRQEDLTSRPLSAPWQVSDQPRLYETLHQNQPNECKQLTPTLEGFVGVHKKCPQKKKKQLTFIKKSHNFPSHDPGTLSCFLGTFLHSCLCNVDSFFHCCACVPSWGCLVLCLVLLLSSHGEKSCQLNLGART